MRPGFTSVKCRVWPVFFCLFIFGCQSSSSKDFEDEDSIPIEDFGLGAQAGDRRSTGAEYFKDRERSTAAVPFRSSFPFAFAISGSRSNFRSIPMHAQQPLPSRLTLRMGNCVMFLLTGPVQARRYLFTGDWVKFGEEIPANRTQFIEKRTDLNLRLASQLSLEIPDPHFHQCKQVLYGRRTFIGRYHMLQSEANLIGDDVSQVANFERADANHEGTKVYIHWHQDSQLPLLINDLEFPAVVKSPVYRAQLGDRGFYYVSFQPVLRMQNVDRLVIQIPLPEQLQAIQKRRANP